MKKPFLHLTIAGIALTSAIAYTGGPLPRSRAYAGGIGGGRNFQQNYARREMLSQLLVLAAKNQGFTDRLSRKQLSDLATAFYQMAYFCKQRVHMVEQTADEVAGSIASAPVIESVYGGDTYLMNAIATLIVRPELQALEQRNRTLGIPEIPNLLGMEEVCRGLQQSSERLDVEADIRGTRGEEMPARNTPDPNAATLEELERLFSGEHEPAGSWSMW